MRFVAAASLLFLSTVRGDVPESPTAFLLVGDVQRTMKIERVVLRREQNDAERERLFELIGRETASFVFYLGDMVSQGGRSESWEYFDRVTRPVRESGKREYALHGNHEYMDDLGTMRAEIAKRFPNLRDAIRGTVEIEGLAILYLDSNEDEIDPEEWREQSLWLERELDRIDLDPKVRGAIVLLHHPPFTNNRLIGEDKRVRKDLLPKILASRKTIATFAGHTHAYEHFIESGKHFIVSGGGGGARHALRTGESRRRDDLYAGGKRRPFHYLRLETSASGLVVTAIGFDKGETEARELDRIEIPFAD